MVIAIVAKGSAAADGNPTKYKAGTDANTSAKTNAWQYLQRGLAQHLQHISPPTPKIDDRDSACKSCNESNEEKDPRPIDPSGRRGMSVCTPTISGAGFAMAQ